MQNVLVGVSGGVDSSVAAAVLKEKGFFVSGATLLLNSGENAKKDIADAKTVCEKIDIPYYVYDLSDEFKKEVIDYFVSAYKKGLTPNPCIVCNRLIKFKALIDKADVLGADYIATGHYSKIIRDNNSGRMLLLRPSDPSKDQTYVLYSLTQSQLERTVMPLSDYTKEEVRAIAKEKGLITADRPDSQDICFVPDGDYAGFIENYTGKALKKGNYTDIYGKVIGTHSGVEHYTVGQRKGLGIALGKPAFVISKNAALNTVVIGDEEHLFKKEVDVDNLNFIPFETLNGNLRVKAKLRYRHKEQDATLVMTGENTARLYFDTPVRAPAPGQAAVFYDGEIVIGGGTIL